MSQQQGGTLAPQNILQKQDCTSSETESLEGDHVTSREVNISSAGFLRSHTSDDLDNKIE